MLDHIGFHPGSNQALIVGNGTILTAMTGLPTTRPGVRHPVDCCDRTPIFHTIIVPDYFISPFLVSSNRLSCPNHPRPRPTEPAQRPKNEDTAVRLSCSAGFAKNCRLDSKKPPGPKKQQSVFHLFPTDPEQLCKKVPIYRHAGRGRHFNPVPTATDLTTRPDRVSSTDQP
jgi:hypothetical protein